MLDEQILGKLSPVYIIHTPTLYVRKRVPLRTFCLWCALRLVCMIFCSCFHDLRIFNELLFVCLFFFIKSDERNAWAGLRQKQRILISQIYNLIEIISFMRLQFWDI